MCVSAEEHAHTHNRGDSLKQYHELRYPIKEKCPDAQPSQRGIIPPELHIAFERQKLEKYLRFSIMRVSAEELADRIIEDTHGGKHLRIWSRRVT